jgi:hypothetical protein
MKHNIKPITKQLAISVLFLISVTVLSFGIREIRFSIHRLKTAESNIVDTGEKTSVNSSNTKEKSQSERSFWAGDEPDYYPDDSYIAGAEKDDYSSDSYTVDVEPDPQYVKAPGSKKKALLEDYSSAKSLKGEYAKAEGKNGLQKISLGDNENIYITEKGEAWYVSKEADGSTTKMQVQMDNTGEMTVVRGGNYAKSGGSQGLQRISLSDREDLYLTGEGETWYVSEEADGSTTKVQLEEDVDGELNIVDNGKDD